MSPFLLTMLPIIPALLLILSWLNKDNYPPWVSWHNEVFAFAAVIAWAGMLLWGGRSIEKYSLPRSLIIAIGFLGLIVAQLLYGYIHYVGDAIVFSFYIILSCIAIICGYHALLKNSLNEEQGVEYFAKVIVIGGVFSAFVALVQAFDVWHELGWIARNSTSRRPGANFNQPNHLATFLLMGLASASYLFEKRHLHRASLFAISSIFILGLVATESRTGLLSFLLMEGWWLLKHKKIQMRLKLSSTLSTVAAVVILFIAWPSFLTLFQDIDTSLVQGLRVNTSGGTRLIVWPQLIDASFQRPWFGWGMGGVSTALNSVLSTYISSDNFTYAHNIVLDCIVGFGYPITILIIVAFVAWLRRSVRKSNTILGWYGMAFLLPFGVHAMFEFPYAYAYFLAPTMFVIGVLLRHFNPKRELIIGRRYVVASFSMVCIFLVWAVVEYISIEEDYRIARLEERRIGHATEEYIPPSVFILTQLKALSIGARIQPRPLMQKSEIDILHNVAFRFPMIATQQKYAMALALNGREKEAERQLKVLKAMYGEVSYQLVKNNWERLANQQYPELYSIILP